MTYLITAFILVTLFSISAHFFAQNMFQPIDWISRGEMYSRRALRIERNYKVFAWGLLTLFLLVSTVISAYQVFVEL